MEKNKNYCVYLTTYSGKKLPPFYIGYSTVQKVENGYHGSVSSKKYKTIYEKELIDNPDFFRTEILETFFTKKEAQIAETKEQIKVKANKNPQYMNEIIHSNTYIDLRNGDISPKILRRQTTIIIRKMSKSPLKLIERLFLESLDKEYIKKMIPLAFHHKKGDDKINMINKFMLFFESDEVSFSSTEILRKK